MLFLICIATEFPGLAVYYKNDRSKLWVKSVIASWDG